eukprot:341720_1
MAADPIELKININATDDEKESLMSYDENSEEHNIPTFTRRLSSQFLPVFDHQSSIVDHIPDAITNHIPGLARNPITRLTETYFCHICFTKYAISEGHTLINCQHQFCPQCLKGFI